MYHIQASAVSWAFNKFHQQFAPRRLHVPAKGLVGLALKVQRDWYFIAEQPAPAPHLARPEGRAALTH